jgi:hypothetical protein
LVYDTGGRIVAVHPDTQMVEPMVDCVTLGLSAPGVQTESGSGRYRCEQVARTVTVPGSAGAGDALAGVPGAADSSIALIRGGTAGNDRGSERGLHHAGVLPKQVSGRAKLNKTTVGHSRRSPAVGQCLPIVAVLGVPRAEFRRHPP